MGEIKRFLRTLLYGWLFEHHIKKSKIISREHQTVLRYHYEMALHYYEKMYRKKYKEK